MIPGFLAPAYLLLLAPLVAGLIYAYLHRGKARRQLVSSNIIFSKIKSTPTVRQKVRFPRRFFYELLLLSLLSLAIAGFYWSKPGRPLLVLIDNSWSMGAQIDQNQNTVLSQNIAQLRNDRQEKYANLTGVKICFTAPSYNCWSEDFQDWEQVASRLDQIKTFPVGDGIDAVLSSLTIGNDVDLVVYSDYHTNNLQTSNRLLSTARIGALSNLAIADIQNTGNGKVSVQIDSFALTPVQHQVRLYSLAKSGNKLAISQIREKEFKVAPQEKVNIIFDIKGDVAAVIAEINPENLVQGIDALPDDNLYYQLITTESPVDVVLVSNRTLAQSGLQKIFSKGLKVIKESEYPQLASNKSKTLWIFENYIPAKLPSGNHLIIGSNAEPGFYASTIQDQATTISYWNKDSELLRYLAPNLLEFKKVWTANLPSWYQSIIATESGTIMAAGYNQQVRSVYLGFPILPFSSEDNQALSILTLNILKWLEHVEPARGAVDLQSASLWQLQKGKLVSTESIDSGIGFLLDTAKAEYQVHNFYSAEESDLTSIRKINFTPTVQAAGSASSATESTGNSSLLFAVLLLLLIGNYIWREGKTQSHV